MYASTTMKHVITQIATRHGLDLTAEETHLSLDNPPYMRLVIEKNGSRFVSVAHYYEQNGDLVADPDMSFWIGSDGGWYPVDITHGALGLYQRVMEFNAEGTPYRLNQKGQRDLRSFANTWARNIRDQGFISLKPTSTAPALPPIGPPDPTQFFAGLIGKAMKVHWIWPDGRSALCGSGQSSHAHNYRRAQINRVEGTTLITCQKCATIAGERFPKWSAELNLLHPQDQQDDNQESTRHYEQVLPEWDPLQEPEPGATPWLEHTSDLIEENWPGEDDRPVDETWDEPETPDDYPLNPDDNPYGFVPEFDGGDPPYYRPDDDIDDPVEHIFPHDDPHPAMYFTASPNPIPYRWDLEEANSGAELRAEWDQYDLTRTVWSWEGGGWPMEGQWVRRYCLINTPDIG